MSILVSFTCCECSARLDIPADPAHIGIRPDFDARPVVLDQARRFRWRFSPTQVYCPNHAPPDKILRVHLLGFEIES